MITILYPGWNFADIDLGRKNVSVCVWKNGSVDIEIDRCLEGTNTIILTMKEIAFIILIFNELKNDVSDPTTIEEK